MNLKTITLIALYIAIGAFTYWVCSPAGIKKTQTDKILIPLVAIFWPIPWTFIFANEVVGFFNRKIKSFQRNRRIAKKEKQRIERLKKMNP